MKEPISSQDVLEIKARVEKMSTFQINTITSIPLGVLWLGLGMIDLLYIADRQIPLFAESQYRIILHIVQLFLIIPTIMGVVLVGSIQYFFYTRKFGTWLPYLGIPMRYWLMIPFVLVIFTVILFYHYWSGTTFPWMGLFVGILYSALGVMEKSSRRWYYPAIALSLMGVSFLPLLLGADGLLTRITCFLTYGLTLLFTGWFDHRNLMRIHQSMVEVPDGQTI